MAIRVDSPMAMSPVNDSEMRDVIMSNPPTLARSSLVNPDEIEIHVDAEKQARPAGEAEEGEITLEQQDVDAKHEALFTDLDKLEIGQAGHVKQQQQPESEEVTIHGRPRKEPRSIADKIQRLRAKHKEQEEQQSTTANPSPPASTSTSVATGASSGSRRSRKIKYRANKDMSASRGPPHHRGGNHNGNNYGGGRKRRFNDREDDDHYGGRPQNRRRHDPPPGTKLRNDMLRIAERGIHNVEDELKEISKLVTSTYHDEFVRNVYWDTTLQIICEQPCKIVFLAAIARHANRDKPELIATLLKKAGELAQRNLRAGQWTYFKHVIRFLACCQTLYSDEGVFIVLEDLFQSTIELQTASPDDVIGLELVKIILLTLPYVMSSRAPGLEEKAAQLLEKTDIVASAPQPLAGIVEPYWSPDGSDDGPSCPSLLATIQRQLQNEASINWTLAVIPTFPFADDGKGKDSIDDMVEDAKPDSAMHSFPTITMPSPINPGPQVLFPEIFFSIFAGQDTPSVPALTDISSTIIRDVVVDTVNAYHGNRMVAAKFVHELDHYFSPNTFCLRATPVQRLKEVPTGSSTWKSEDLAIDAIFSQMMHLPMPQHKLVYYHSVLTAALQTAVSEYDMKNYHLSVSDMSKASASAVAPSLGRAIRFLFKSLGFLDLELQYRFLDWFAHHLSNFEFRWKWNEWIDEIELNKLHPKRVFIISALDKEIRLSFAKRVNSAIPVQWQDKHVITAEQMREEPTFKYDDDTVPFARQGRELYTLLRKKTDINGEVDALIKNIEAEAEAQGVQDPSVISTDIFITSICHVGSKSLSHVLSAIEKSKHRLLAIGPASEAARRQILTSVTAYWQHQPGTAVNIIDKLLNYTIITPMAVIQWALGDNMNKGEALASNMALELISATMQKVRNRVRQIVKARNDSALLNTADDRPELKEQATMLDETLGRERQSMRDLFATILDAVKPVAEGAQDEMIEPIDGDGPNAGGAESLALLKAWGGKWVKTWTRKLAVEDATVGDAAVAVQAECVIINTAIEKELAEQEVAMAQAAAAAAEERDKARQEARDAREAARREGAKDGGNGHVKRNETHDANADGAVKMENGIEDEIHAQKGTEGLSEEPVDMDVA